MKFKNIRQMIFLAYQKMILCSTLYIEAHPEVVEVRMQPPGNNYNSLTINI